MLEFKNKKYNNLTPKGYEVLSETALHIIFENEQSVYFDINCVLIEGKKYETINEFVIALNIKVVKKTIEQLNEEKRLELQKYDSWLMRKLRTGEEVPNEIKEATDFIDLKYEKLKQDVNKI